MKVQRVVEITNNLGVHLRAAGSLAQVAGQFDASIWLEHGTHRANAKSIMSVLALAASKGVQLTIVADGDDAQEAVQAVAGIIESGFND